MNAHDDPPPLSEFSADALRVAIFATRAEAGLAAANVVARAIAAKQAETGVCRVVFAAAPSQNEFLAALVRHPAIDWSRVVGFHMDEYLGLGPDHPSSFRLYLREHLFGPAHLSESQLRLIPGERSSDASRVCLEYEESLLAEPPDVVCAGIGENGHLAFNDPPVADFFDPVKVKVVRLDDLCRVQQVHDGGFSQIEDMPRHAITLTVPALLSAPTVSVVVPGPRKANAVLATVRGPISEACPASALRGHKGAVLYLDRASAAGLLVPLEGSE